MPEGRACRTPPRPRWIEPVSVKDSDLALTAGAIGLVDSAACGSVSWRGARLIGAVKDAGEPARLMALSLGESAATDARSLPEEMAAMTEARASTTSSAPSATRVFAQGIDAVAAGSRIAVIARASGASVDLDPPAFHRRDLTWHAVNTTRRSTAWRAPLLRGFGGGFASARSTAWRAPLLRGLGDGFASGALPAVEVDAASELSEAERAAEGCVPGPCRAGSSPAVCERQAVARRFREHQPRE
jgi:hypothetical protein